MRFLARSVGAINCLIAAKTVANFSSYFFSKLSILLARSALLSIRRRSWTNVRMIAMFTCTARELRRTLESIATPCSVKAKGRYLTFWPRFKVTFCDLERLLRWEVVTIRDLILSCSAFVSWNMKSDGNLCELRLTAWFNDLVVTP